MKTVHVSYDYSIHFVMLLYEHYNKNSNRPFKFLFVVFSKFSLFSFRNLNYISTKLKLKTTETTDKKHWILIGRYIERFWLVAQVVSRSARLLLDWQGNKLWSHKIILLIRGFRKKWGFRKKFTMSHGHVMLAQSELETGVYLENTL